MENKEALKYLQDKKHLSDLESLLEERNNLLDEIDYLKDDIDMLKGANDHLASVLDRTEYLLEYERAKNKELEAKIIALTIK